MELKPRSASPTTVPSGVIVQSALAAGSLPEQIGTESAASSSLLAGSSSCTSPLASTVGQVGHLSDRASEPFGSAGGTATTTSTGSSTVAPAKVAPSALSSSCSAPIAVHGKRSPSIATPVKSSNVSGGSSSCIPSPILSPPGKIFGRNNNGIKKVHV
uniref:Uncharacterized protein n=1 Tax=Anopheles coluzzii TaxID=1518534 RepID=A0A8W7PTN5_ANOCL